MKKKLIKVLLVIILLGNIQCTEDKNSSYTNQEREEKQVTSFDFEQVKTQKTDTLTKSEKQEIIFADEMFSKGYSIDNSYVLQNSSRENIWIDKTPAPLKDVSKKLELPCPDTFPTCSVCGYCTFIKLSKDWSYFGFEQIETKNFNNIYIFKRNDTSFHLIDTLYGTVVHAKPRKNSNVYQITLLEAYWGDVRPKNLEIYTFKEDKYFLEKSHKAGWVKSQTISTRSKE